MADEKIVPFTGITTLDLPPERVLQNALKKDLDCVIIMGYDSAGEIYFASSNADGGDVMWLMRKCEMALLRGGFDE